MAISPAPVRIGRLRGSQRATGGLNKPAMVTVPERDWDEALAEIVALRREGREIGALLPRAQANYHYIAALGECIAAEQNAAAIYYAVHRAAQRHCEGES